MTTVRELDVLKILNKYAYQNVGKITRKLHLKYKPQETRQTLNELVKQGLVKRKYEYDKKNPNIRIEKFKKEA